MSQVKTLNCWKQFPRVSAVVQLHLFYLLKPVNPSPSHSPCAHRGSTLLDFLGKEAKAEKTG